LQEVEEVKPPARYEPATRRPRSAETRAKLMRAALALFREKGYHGAGTNDIGAAAGLTGPSIYRHFATKDEILVTAVIEGARALGAGVRDVEPDADPLQVLTDLSRSYVKTALGDPELFWVFFNEARHMPDEAKRELDRNANAYFTRYERQVVKLCPDLSKLELQLRVRGALHLVAGLVNDPALAVSEAQSGILIDRMLASLLAEV